MKDQNLNSPAAGDVSAVTLPLHPGGIIMKLFEGSPVASATPATSR